MKSELHLSSIHYLKLLIDMTEHWCKDTTEIHPKTIVFSFLKSVITTWRMNELVR